MRDFASPRDQSFVWDYGREPFKISHHPAKYCHHRHCDSGDIMILACHLILQDHVIKESCDFCGWEPLMISQYPAKFGDHRHCGSADVMLLVVEEENFRCSQHIILLTPILVTRTQSSWTKNWKQLFPVRPKARTRKRKSKKGKAIAKCFALDANA